MKYPEQINVHVFKEHPVKNYLGEEYQEFDIIGKHIGVIDFLVLGKFSDLSYCKAVIAKFAEISKSQIKDFLNYQLSLINDKKRWLVDLEKLIDINPGPFNKIRPSLQSEISSCLTDLLNRNENEFKPQNRLIWKGDDVDLLEVIIALTESKAITNLQGKTVRSEILKVFEEIFGLTIKDANKKIGSAIGRKRDNAPFLKSMLEAYENYARQAKNK